MMTIKGIAPLIGVALLGSAGVIAVQNPGLTRALVTKADVSIRTATP